MRAGRRGVVLALALAGVGLVVAVVGLVLSVVTRAGPVYTVAYAPEGLARTQTPPPKTDESGKKAAYTQKELEDLKAPSGAPGYAIAKTDLAAGAIVDVILVRDKSIAADKVTEGDLRVKYATVTGTAPTPPTPANDGNKKKKN